MEVRNNLFLEKIKKDNTSTFLKIKEEESEEIDNKDPLVKDQKAEEEVEDKEDKDHQDKEKLHQLKLKNQPKQSHEIFVHY